MPAHIVILSGGLDSTVALADTLQHHPDTAALSFDYGQTHGIELAYARAVARHYHIPHHVAHVGSVFQPSALTGDTPIPHADYDADTMTDTVVHGRNLLFTAHAIARTEPGGTVTVGVHSGDHDLYPDCRPDFWRNLQATAAAYDVNVRTPLLHLDKAQIVAYGARLDAPLHFTYSCYEGGQRQCGTCGTCRERRAAFTQARITDPTEYAA